MVSFFMDAVAPSVSMLFPLNQQYTTRDVQLEFAVDKPTKRLTYRLDGAENVTVQGNTTLAGYRWERITLLFMLGTSGEDGRFGDDDV
jgi:hypothetical protein